MAAVEEEAERRRRGDDDARRAYEDDIANLEDTAAEAVRELREGLRDCRAAYAPGGDAAPRLVLHAGLRAVAAEQDVRALEETAAGNIATQKLEEEMLRAEVDDGLAQMQDAVEEMREEVGRHCETIAAAAGGAAEPVTRRVEVLEASVAGAAAARLVENEAYRAEFEQSVFAEAATRERSMREMASRIDANIEDAKREAGVDVAVATEALRAAFEAQTREAAAKHAGALEETAERKSGRVGGREDRRRRGRGGGGLGRSVLEPPRTRPQSETLRALRRTPSGRWRRCRTPSRRASGSTRRRRGLRERRCGGGEGGGDEAAAGAGAGGEEDAKSVHRHLRAKEKLGEMQRD